MEGWEIPNKLHHYTTIESLALILKQRILRFTKLSLLNDPLEGKTADVKGAENLVFCSSWTSNTEDIIPMWKMYSNMKGVRISVSPLNMFKNTNGIKSGNWGSGEINYTELDVKIFASGKWSVSIKEGDFNFQRHLIEIDKIFGPDPVSYNPTPEPAVINKVKIFSKAEEFEVKEYMDFSKVGLHKHTNWEFENEVRFRLLLNPKFGAPYGFTSEEFVTKLEFMNKYINVFLSDEFFNGLNILFGPLCTASQEIMVGSLLKEYAPSAKISKSKIKIR